jgi:hypothetical protein
MSAPHDDPELARRTPSTAAARSATSLSSSPKRDRGWGDAGQPSSSAIVPAAALIAAYHAAVSLPPAARLGMPQTDRRRGPFGNSVGRPAGAKSRPRPIISTVMRTALFGPRPPVCGHLCRRAARSDPGPRTGLRGDPPMAIFCVRP